MWQCAVCGKETILLVKGVPLCPKCDDEREAKIKRILEDQLKPKRPDPDSDATSGE